MRRKSKGIPALAEAFAVIGAEASKVESRADHVLAIVRTSKIHDEKAFSAAVREAYKANGWNVKPGKPKNGDAKGAVPATVKQYVSTVRSAFRAGLEPWKAKTFHQLRKAVKAARLKAKPKLNGVADIRLEGVRLVKSDTLTGAPFHDLIVAYESINKQQRHALTTEVNAIVKKYTVAAVTAKPELVLLKAA